MSRNTDPVARLWAEGCGAIVTKTHDVAAARDALLAMIRNDYCADDDEALEMMQPFLDSEPRLEVGAWRREGFDDDAYTVWRTDAEGRGITRAVVWYSD